ncbi:DNA helicase-2/ATP-dependent DNA helicase PcrA [Sedimentibacter acidaminivorans]|uniref:DNA helicase-2/ATP-dependent DNA helicase PcrA n=1 Tax=Sedimentibacter acidaminivorans TaxID=913099 RepID=A0ABS4GEY9_9FIRM|nr:UvrD-helicase domain-containing protein [Sedimentibacter acidaminivorans]MBP1926261.1 DNA helicase-2/ATP-dependent DNA helicase PcrA [Sedimentibacter acidaminivorans]
MSEYKRKYIEETNYLKEIIDLISYKLEIEANSLENKKKDLIEARKEMWENATHSSADFDKVSDANQYLSALQNQTLSYTDSAKLVSKFEKMLDSPYFARIDFTENGYDDTEKIYIGLFNLMDEETHEIKIHDWRAPISSIFYRSETGPVEYIAPVGKIKGNVSLKRQYKIKKGKMEYFFDSNINILDEMLKEALSKNMSSKMKTIVETIQKQQDLIIRDLVNELLIVQGVAGSGKTSVALHRIAFLLYQGLNLNLSSNNIIIISPNTLFSQYISNVLPELGEENIVELTFENIFTEIFEKKLSIKTKSEQLEEIICAKDEDEKAFLRSYADFKGSSTFLEIINRYINYFEHKMIKFEDIYFNGKIIENRDLLKSLLLSNKLNMPTSKKLKIIESRIIDKVHEVKKLRREKIEKIVSNSNNHEFEIQSFARVLAAKETSLFTQKLRQFTEFDCYYLYKTLFRDKNIFFKVAKGLDLPDNINDIIEYTNKNIQDKYNIPYSDGIGLMYLKLKAEGCNLYSNIKQVMVDEAQDYYPIHYNILKTIFREARFTIVGDINQTIEKKSNLSIYDDIISIFNKSKSNKLFLTKSYRNSYEISKFSQKLLDGNINTELFKRNEREPEIIYKSSQNELENKIIVDIEKYKSLGFDSIAIICKSRKQSSDLYFRLKSKINIKLIDSNERTAITGITVIPVYMAKGLEFDCVMVYETDIINYKTDYDKKLLYIACTRALHRLSLYYTGVISNLLA